MLNRYEGEEVFTTTLCKETLFELGMLKNNPNIQIREPNGMKIKTLWNQHQRVKNN